MSQPTPDSAEGVQITGSSTVNVGRDFIARDQNIYIQEALAYDVRGLENPYLGLKSFSYSDHAKYAGRETLVAETVAKITAPGAPVPLLFVTGASGSGKSSFAQAGLVPALEKHYAGLNVKHAVMHPAGDPFANLGEALSTQLGLPALDTTNLTGAIKARADGVYEYEDADSATPSVKRTAAAKAMLMGILLDLVNVSLDDDPRRDMRQQRTLSELV